MLFVRVCGIDGCASVWLSCSEVELRTRETALSFEVNIATLRNVAYDFDDLAGSMMTLRGHLAELQLDLRQALGSAEGLATERILTNMSRRIEEVEGESHALQALAQSLDAISDVYERTEERVMGCLTYGKSEGHVDQPLSLRSGEEVFAPSVFNGLASREAGTAAVQLVGSVIERLGGE